MYKTISGRERKTWKPLCAAKINVAVTHSQNSRIKMARSCGINPSQRVYVPLVFEPYSVQSSGHLQLSVRHSNCHPCKYNRDSNYKSFTKLYQTFIKPSKSFHKNPTKLYINFLTTAPKSLPSVFQASSERLSNFFQTLFPTFYTIYHRSICPGRVSKLLKLSQ